MQEEAKETIDPHEAHGPKCRNTMQHHPLNILKIDTFLGGGCGPRFYEHLVLWTSGLF